MKLHILIFLVLYSYSAHAKMHVDLSYIVDEATMSYFPSVSRFNRYIKFRGLLSEDLNQPDGSRTWFEEWDYNTTEHAGTHIDAPLHFGKNGAGDKWDIVQIPADRLMGPAVVVDISNKIDIDSNPDYGATIQDIKDHENKYGTIPPGAILLLHTGWGKYWGDNKRYVGTDTRDENQAHFPSLSAEAAQWIADDGRIVGFGVDTSSCDPGNIYNVQSHVNLFEMNIYCIENIAHLERVPLSRHTLYMANIDQGRKWRTCPYLCRMGH